MLHRDIHHDDITGGIEGQLHFSGARAGRDPPLPQPLPGVAAQNREWDDSAKLWAMYDMKKLEKLKDMEANAPETMKAYRAFDKAAMSPGAISGKNKELMALAVAFTTQCPYCIEIHSKKARQAGASEQEISEVVFIAAALRAGAAVTHGTHALA